MSNENAPKRSERVNIGGDIWIMSPVTITQSNVEELSGAGVEIEAEYDQNLRKLVAKQVRVTASDTQPEITNALLHKVRVQHFLRASIRQLFPLGAPNEHGVQQAFSIDPLPKELQDQVKLEGPTNKTLSAVAATYRLAEVVNDSPTKAVQDRFGIPRPTAANWVTRARSAGLLDG